MGIDVNRNSLPAGPSSTVDADTVDGQHANAFNQIPGGWAALPEGVNISDVPSSWPADGMFCYTVAAGAIKSMSEGGLLMHLARSSRRVQYMFIDGAGTRVVQVRQAAAAASAWDAWSLIADSHHAGHGSGIDADTLDGVEGALYARMDRLGAGSTQPSGQDWNNSALYRPGSGSYLLYGDDANGPTPEIHHQFHVFSLEYGTAKDGSGNLTTLAIPYANTAADGIYMRSRFGGVWSAWSKLFCSTNDGSGSGLDADKLDGAEGSEYVKAADALVLIQEIDGPGSGIDADTLDGHQATEFFLLGGNALTGASFAISSFGGLCVKLTNQAGRDVKRGEMVQAHTNALSFKIDEGQSYGWFGAVVDPIASGAQGWICVSGVTPLLLVNNLGVNAGNWLAMMIADKAGRWHPFAALPDLSNFPCAIALETVAGGTDKVALASIQGWR